MTTPIHHSKRGRNRMKLNPAPNSFGIDKLEFVTREPLKKEFMASMGHVPPSGDWRDKTYRYMVSIDVEEAAGALEVFWEPRKWVRDTYPYKAIFNPSRAGYNGWETWDYLTWTVFSWLSNARVRRVDTKLDFNNTLAEVLSSVVLKGAKRVFIDSRHPRTIYIGEMGGVQLVIYDKGLQLWGTPDILIRVEIRQWFETDAWAQRRRPFMMEFMRGDLVGTHPFKDVAWIDPDRLAPQMQTVAEEKGLNYALLDDSIDLALREKTRRQIWRYGTDDIHRLYLAGAERWHGDFIMGLERDRFMRAVDARLTRESPNAGMTLEEILFGGDDATSA
jgi:hypothetical protein